MAPPTRRQFLLAAGASSLLIACGDKERGRSSDSTSSSSSSSSDAALNGVAFFGGDVLKAGGMVRAPIGVADHNGTVLKPEDLPDTLTIKVSTNGTVVEPALKVARHNEGLQRPYYPVIFEAKTAGSYDFELSGLDRPLTVAATVSAPEAVPVPGPGDKLPSVKTPTTEDHAGVEQICTAEPPCPLHDRSVDELLAAKEPFALIISTPAYCQQSICGPVLDVALGEHGQFKGLPMVHCEVYAKFDQQSPVIAPMLEAMKLSYEPLAVMVKGDGTIQERIDFIFDALELREALGRLAATAGG